MLEIKNVTKKYKPKKGVPVIALDNVSLNLQEKGMVFVLGKSGSGKSTLLNVLGGLDKYDSGEIIIKGKSSKDFSQSDFDSYRNTYVGFIFQEYNILEEFTVGANIALAMELQGKKATDEIINNIMDEVDLSGYGSRKPNELSGGQMQRVAIARALVKNPEIIMADEPTGALDSKTGIQVFETLKKLSKTKLVLIVSHDREFAEQYGDRVIEFSDGKIISDIEKQVTEPTSKSDGVNIVDDSIIYIKKGYKLNPEDVELINNYIGKSTSDVFISTDGNTNNQIKKLSKIDEDGNREIFRPTDYQAIKNNASDNNKFKLIKSKLPFKDSLKIGASGLRGKPFRLFFTIFLSMISFALFGLADTMGSYDKINTTVTSIIDSSINNLAFGKQIRVNDKYSDYDYYNNTNMSEADIDLLNERLGIDFKPVYSGNDRYENTIYLNNNFQDTTKIGSSWDSYYQQRVSGFAEFTSEEINELDFNVIGQMPTDFTEVAVSTYIYEHFKTAGYRNNETSIKPEDINSEQDMIGKFININNVNYKITAIIDTELNSERYESLKNENRNNEAGFVDYIKVQELNIAVNYGYHGLVFVQPGFIENIMQNNDSIGLSIYTIGDLSMYVNTSYGSYHTQFSHIVKISDIKDSIFMFEAGKETLTENEVILNAADYLNNIELDEIALLAEDIPNDIITPENYTFGQHFSNLRYMSITQYAESNYEAAFQAGFTAVMGGMDIADDKITEGDKITAYFQYLMHFSGSFNNEYGDKNGFDLEWEAKKNLIFKYSDQLFVQNKNTYSLITAFYNTPNFDGDKEKEVDVVGYYIPNSTMIDYREGWEKVNSYLVVDDVYYATFEEKTSGPYGFAIGKLPTKPSEIKKLVQFSEDSKIDGVKYNMQNEVTYILEQVSGMIEPMAKVFLYVGIGFAVFSALLLFNFITTSISNKKREIGVLRALGSRSNDVFGIFLNESLIIAFINFVLAFIIALGVVIYLNNFLRSEYGILITFLNFGIRQVFLMLVVSVGVAIIASFLPVYRISHKKPIDAIRNR